MAPDAAKERPVTARKEPVHSFTWVSSSPTPAEVASLEILFPDVVQVPCTALEEEIDSWEKVAILVRTFQRWVPPDALLREFRRAGVPGEIQFVSLAHRCHIVKFSDPSAKRMVLEQPWIVNGQPVASEDWRADFFPAQDSVSSALVWIRLPNLPMEYWSESILRSIVAPAGCFVFADPLTVARSRAGFARVCVRTDLSLPLRPGVRVRGALDPFWQPFVYEHMEGICCYCGSLHLRGPCNLGPQSDPSTNSSPPCFGPWMVAVRRRRGVLPAGKASASASPASSPSSAAQATKDPSPASSSPGLAPSIVFAASSVGNSSDEWNVPLKVARRRHSKLSKSPESTASLSALQGGDGCLAPSRPCFIGG